MTIEQIKAKAAALTAAQSTEQLVQAFELTDTLMVGASTEEHMDLATARGFIIDELESRGDEGLIGL